MVLLAVVVVLLFAAPVAASTWADVIQRVHDTYVADDEIIIVKPIPGTTGYEIRKRKKTEGGTTVAWYALRHTFPTAYPLAGTHLCQQPANAPVTFQGPILNGSPDLASTNCIGGTCKGFGGGGQSCVTTDAGGACASCIASGTRSDYSDNFGCAGQPLAQTGPASVTVSAWSPVSVLEGGRYRAGATAASPCSGATPTACTVNDVLVATFTSTTAGSCTPSTVFMINVGGKSGIDMWTVAPGCIPDGYILESIEDNGDWRVRKFVGDPAEPSYGPNCTAGAPTTRVTPPTTGYTLSPWGTPGSPPGGSGGSLGGGTSGGGGAGGAGGTSAGGGSSSGSPANGGGGVPGGSTTGPSGGSQVQLGQSSVGAIAAGVKEGLDKKEKEKEDECGGASGTDCLPTSGTYDTSITPPTEESILSLVRGYLTSNPLIAAIRNSRIEATAGSCTMAGPTLSYGSATTFDFCWMESGLVVVGNLLFGFAGLMAVIYAWRA